jgi:4-carboxymuconolactone decarboxylase
MKVHIHGALTVGLSRQEVIEIVNRMAVFPGFPVALHGMFAVKEVFQEQKRKEQIQAHNSSR